MNFASPFFSTCVLRSFFLAIFCVLAGAEFSSAATITSQANGNWNAPGTWDLGRAPADGDDVVIADGTTVTVNVAVSFPTYGSLTVGQGTSGTLNIGAFAVTINGDLVTNAGATISCSSATGAKTFNNITNFGTWTNNANAVILNCVGNFDNEGTFTQNAGTLNLTAANGSYSYTNNGTHTITTGVMNFTGAATTFSYTNNATFTAGTGTVTFSGATTCNYYVGGNDPFFYNLTLNNATLNFDATMLSNLTVANNFNLTNGKFIAPGIFTLKNCIVANSATAILNAGAQINVSGIWNAGNATSFVPGTGNVTFNGTAAQTIGTVTGLTFYDVEINNPVSVSLTNNFTYTVFDNLTIDAGATLISGSPSTINVGNEWINNGGTFTPSTGTVNFNSQAGYNYINGSALNQTFYNLTVTNVGNYLDATALTSLTVNGTFTMASGGLNPPANMTVADSVVLKAGTFYSPTTNLNVGGNWVLASGAIFDYYDCGCDGVVTFNGAAAQSIGGTATSQHFQSITLNKTGTGAAGTLTISNTAVTVNGELTLTKGALAVGIDTLTLNGQVYQTAGTLTSTGIVIYQNFDQQSVATGSYVNLAFDDNNKVLLPGTITVSGIFTAGASSGGSAVGNTMSFTGNTSQVIPTFNFDGVAGGSGYGSITYTTAKVFNGSLAFSGVLNCPTGNITLGANGLQNLVLGPTASINGSGASKYVVIDSSYRLIRAFNTGAQSYTYPVGTATNYTPVTLTFNNVTAAGDVGVTFTAAIDPHAIAPPAPATNWLKKYWVFDANSTGFGFDYYSANVTYLASDYNTNLGVADEPTMASMIWVSHLFPADSWSSSSIITNRTTKNPTVSGITNLGDLTFTTCVALGDAGDPIKQGICGTDTLGTATFSVGVTGTPASYQWYENGISLGADHGIYSGTQTSQLTLNFSSSATSYNGHTYYCVVTGICSGGFTSATAKLIVATEPPPTYTLTVNPTPNLVFDPNIVTGVGRWTDELCYGSVITYTCNASGGVLPITYTWIDFESFLDYTSSSNTWVIDTKNDLRLDGTSYASGGWWDVGADDILVNAGNACGTSCCDVDQIILVDSQRTPPTLNAKIPNTANVCVGQNVSATFNAGHGGYCTDGLPYNDTTEEPKVAPCTDNYVYVINGGTPVPYTPGASIPVTDTITSVVIMGERGNTNIAASCPGTGFDTLASWTVNSSILVSLSAANVDSNGVLAICNGASVTFKANTPDSAGSPTYNFKVNSVSIQNGLSATYTNNTLNNNDTITCTISGTGCSGPATATSNPIIVKAAGSAVNATVTLTASPSGAVCSATGVTFTATPTNGGTAPTYNFTVNGVSAQNDTLSNYRNNHLNNNDTVNVIMTSNAACVSVPVVSATGIIEKVLPSPTTFISQAICSGQSYDGHNNTGTFVDTFNAFDGCDSIRTLTLTVIKATSDTIEQTICKGQSYEGHNTAGLFTDTLTAQGGCDSIVRTLNLSIINPTFIEGKQVICQGDTFAGYTATGHYKDTVHATGGCDSIILNLELEVLPASVVPQITQHGDTLISTVSGNYAWYMDSTLLTDTSRTLVISQSGKYYVLVTDSSGSCSTGSAIYDAFATGINEVSDQPLIAVYPDPASDVLNIQISNLSSAGNITMRLYDGIGKLLLSRNFAAPAVSTQFSISELPEGIYFLNIQQGNWSFTKKVMIER